MAHAYCGTPVDLTDFLMHRECFEAIKSLRLNSDIMITKPDKGSGVVILNKTDYLTKMSSILNDSSKFQNIGPRDVAAAPQIPQLGGGPQANFGGPS